jgi:hypothetical protein
MAVKLEFKTTRAGYYESRVRSILLTLCAEVDKRSVFYIDQTASSIQSLFTGELKQIPRRSTATAENCYRSQLSENGLELTIHHLTAIGDPDRVVAVVTTIK